ncbi:MAG: EF-hand domain-containing protein [Gemmatimonas sp.]|jgi:hypothetical protein
MLFALGAAVSVLDGLQSLASSAQSSASSSGQGGTPFDLLSGTQGSGSSGAAAPTGFGAQISPQTMSALLDAQGQAGSTNAASLSGSNALNDLFSQIDTSGDGQITKSEFENALGAGGTNVAQADSVFNKLDTNGDGSVSLGELKSALQGARGQHGHHHHHVQAADQSSTTDSSGGAGSGSGLSVGSLISVDPSQLTPISFSTSSYNLMQQMIQRGSQALSASIGSSLAVSA